MGTIGYLLHNTIKEQIIREALVYDRAFKPTSVEQFQYGAQTSIGDALMFGTVSAIDPVSTEYAEGKYTALEVVQERYTMHTRIVDITDSKGRKIGSRVEVYYTWDVVHREKKQATTFKFYDFVANVDELRIRNDYVSTNTDGYDRWEVYGVPASFNATLFVDLKDNSILPVDSRDIEVYRDKSVQQVVEAKDNNTEVVVFDIVYVLAIIGATVAFVVANNRWLDGGQTILLKLPFHFERNN